jgi:hypothetical protein
MFSSILDISSFFIGMLINLLLIALICYYFKRKYEALELSQNEQAKILYNLIQNQTPKPSFNINQLMTNTNLKNSCSLPNCVEICSDDESTDNSDNESSDSDNESSDEPKSEEVKTLSVNTLLTSNVVTTNVETEELHNITVTKLEELEDLEDEIIVIIEEYLENNIRKYSSPEFYEKMGEEIIDYVTKTYFLEEKELRTSILRN